MCGICGVLNVRRDEAVSPTVLRDMNSKLAHRGPDDHGIYVDRFVGLGHCRLSVIDLASGRQPLSNEDGSIWVTYNGEIYNYKELRDELTRVGHRFATNCDTEIIVHAYEEYGQECVRRFNGMFAFALWDQREERLFLARDRLGIKPLHYGMFGATFIFASEIKAILQHPLVSTEVEVCAIPEYLLCTTLLNSKTMFKNVASVPPGTTITIENGLARTHRYWSMERDAARHRGDSFEECQDRVRGLLDTAIRIQAVSDVPLGTLLSGGLDSSLVSAIATRHIGGKLKTFSMGYRKCSTLRKNDTDEYYANLVAAAYDTDHTNLAFDPDEYGAVMQHATWNVEKPVDLTSPSLYLLYREIKPKVTVVMSGEGADELFAGYHFFHNQSQNGVPSQFPWAPYLNEVAGLIDPALEKATGYRERIQATLADEMSAFDTEDEGNKILYLFLKYYLVEMLERLDKTSMAWGVESRVPFLDHRMVEYVLHMPYAFKTDAKTEKILLKSIATQLLPNEIPMRTKRPVPIPVDPRTVLEARSRANELVRAPNTRIGHYFDKTKVNDFLNKRADYSATQNLAVYRTSHALIALDAWHAAFGI